jgi:23S rRNA pseudouridine2457 synthase
MYQYLLFHKPYGVLPQFTDGSPEPRPTLAGYIDIPDIYPVGRLDLDSEGLLFLTDDNWVKHRMLDPEFNHPRTSTRRSKVTSPTRRSSSSAAASP